MRALLCCTFVAVVAVTGVLLAQSAEKEDAMHGSAREKLIGALASGFDGRTERGWESTSHYQLEWSADLHARWAYVGADYVPEIRIRFVQRLR